MSVQPLGQGRRHCRSSIASSSSIRMRRCWRRATTDCCAPADGEVADADARPGASGALEGSNVNVAKTLVNMIELARQYEMQVNVMNARRRRGETPMLRRRR